MSVDDTLKLAFLHHQENRLTLAEEAYRTVLREEPTNPDALHLLGVLQGQYGFTTASAKYIRQAIEVRPVFPEAWSNLGNAYKTMGSSKDAELCYRTSLEQRPDFIDALFNLGLLLFVKERWAEAEALFRRTVTLKMDHTLAWRELGYCYAHMDRFHDALLSFRQAISLGYREASIYLRIAMIQYRIGSPEDVYEAWREAVGHPAVTPDILTQLVLLMIEDRSARLEIEGILRKNLMQHRDNADLQRLLAHCLLRQGRLEEALQSIEIALRLAPANAEVQAYAGMIYMANGFSAAAERAINQAIKIAPDSAGVLNLQGTTLITMADYRTGRPRVADALVAINKAIDLVPDYAEALTNRGLIQLAQGQFQQGWIDYAHRLRLRSYKNRHAQIPMWGNRSVRGKKILVSAEQGFGDTIQFFRYVPMLAELGAIVVLEMQGALYRLLRYAPGAAGIVIQDSDRPSPPVDGQITLLSLPGYFGTDVNSIPAVITPAIHPDFTATWNGILGEPTFYEGKRRLRVAIAWSGSKAHENDRNRSVPLAFFANILADPRLEVMSVQVGDGVVDEIAALEGDKPRDLSPYLNDFADTAAALVNFDLCIFVDTGAAHLAGTLKIPTWVLLSFFPDWRWQLEGDATPWYPTLRLFRQPAFRDWGSVQKAVEAALDQWIAEQPE